MTYFTYDLWCFAHCLATRRNKMNVWVFSNDVLVTQHTNTDLSGSYV